MPVSIQFDHPSQLQVDENRTTYPPFILDPILPKSTLHRVAPHLQTRSDSSDSQILQTNLTPCEKQFGTRFFPSHMYTCNTLSE